MALSDAVRRMLASKSGRDGAADDLDLPDQADEVAEPAEEVTEEQQGFRDRAAREDERFRLATDSEYWLMFCFRHPDDPARFARALGMEPARIVSGPALAKAVGEKPPLTAAQRTKQMLMARSTRGVDTTARLARRPPPNPVEGLEPTGDISADSRRDFAAILAAFKAPPDPNPVNVLDSPHWMCAYWPSRDPKDEFLTASGLEVLGDKYLDGHMAARTLGLELP